MVRQQDNQADALPASPKAGILLVDDRPENLIALEAILEPLGQNLVRAQSGRDALKHVLTDDFAVILLDVQMPGMDGFETAALIKAREKSRSIPIIFVTALSKDEKYVFRGYSAGAVDYLSKPFDPDILKSKVSVFVDLYHKSEQIKRQEELLRRSEQRETERRQAERERETERRHMAELALAYEKEKRIAETLQRSLLLEMPEDRFSRLRIATFYEAAWDEAGIGGDFFDAFSLEGGKVAFVVGDVTGKGLAAAAHTAEAKYALRAFLRESGRPVRALSRLNAVLCDTLSWEELDPGSFICLSLVVIDAATGQAEFAVAGAEAPLVLSPSGQARAVEVTGLPLGIVPGVKYAAKRVRLQPESVLLLATDGITEARSGDRFLGYDGLMRLAQEAAPLRSPRRIGQAVLDAARDFAGGKLQDDACLLLIRREPPPPIP